MKSQLKVVYRSIDDLILNGKNPRLHSERQIRQIARSIKSFGFNVPVLVDANSNVIADMDVFSPPENSSKRSSQRFPLNTCHPKNSARF
jgi:hypothetical protein